MRHIPGFTLKALFGLIFVSFASSAFAAPSVWIQNASDRAFSTSPLPSNPTTSITLYAAKNEYQGAQILVLSSAAQTGVYVTANALTGPGGATIPTSNITVTTEITHTEVDEIPSHPQIPPGGSNHDGTGNYTDSLETDNAQSVAAGVTQPFYYRVYTSPTQSAGTYTGTATVNSSLGSVTVPVTVVVYPVAIPATNNATYRMNNWFASVGWDYQYTPDVIPLEYNVNTFDTNWWAVVRNIAKNHAIHRNNVIFADYQGLLAGTSTCDNSGNVTPNWANFDEFVGDFASAGALQYLYSPQQMQIDSNGVDQVDILVNSTNNPTGPCTHGIAPAQSTQATNFLNGMFPQLQSHLSTKGWLNNFYISAEDEPQTQSEVNSALWFYGIAKTYFPLTNEAHSKVWSMDAGLTTYTPISNLYDANTAFYQNERINGKDLWLYNDAIPQDTRLNRFISYYLDETRLLMWQDWKIGAVGHLHWGWDYWVQCCMNGMDYGLNPELGYGPSGFPGGFGDGDAWLVRPNKSSYDIFDSVRSEAQLYGIQDYELLNILKQTKPLVAKSIAESLITNFSVFTTSGSSVETAHKEILDQIASTQPDARFAFSDNFSSGNNDNWEQTIGSWSVAGGVYSQTNPGLYQAVSAIKGRSYGDFTLSFNMAITDNNKNPSNWAGAMIRSSNATDIDSGYLIALRDTGQFFLYRSGQTLVQSSNATQITNYNHGTFYPILVVAQGNNIQVYGGNSTVPLINYTDTQNGFMAGNIGLITASAASFTNVVVNAEQNYAEGKTVSYDNGSNYVGSGWGAQAVVDGQTSSVLNASMGYASGDSTGGNLTNPDREEYVQIDFGKTYPVSRVDLYPRNDGANTGYGFPINFTIRVSTDNVNWTTVATETNYPQPGNAVQSFPFTTVNARYLKVDATVLRAEAPGATTYRLEFAEVQAFGGNLAAGKAVTSSSTANDPTDGWTDANATDGATLSNLGYSMGYSSAVSSGTEWVTVDLGGTSTFSTVNLFPRNDGAFTGYGFPIDFMIETSPDNVNWTTVVTETNYPQPTNTVQTFTFTPTTARYVRIYGDGLRTDGEGALRMQFAEIQVE